jgi:PEGA domain
MSGMAVCNTPCATKLEAHSFKLKMTLAGYADWTGEITVEAGKPSTVVADLRH